MAAEPEKNNHPKDVSDKETDAPTSGASSKAAPSDDEDNAADGDAQEGEAENRRARRAAAARARKQRLRERREAEAVGLDTQEVIDDAVARSTDRAAKWMRKNSTVLQGTLVFGLVSWAAWGGYGIVMASAKAKASDAVADAIASAEARIGDPKDANQPDEQGIVRLTPVFETDEARLEAARQAFLKASELREGSGTALYAQLSLAAVQLDLGRYDEALATYNQVLTSSLAKSDIELRGRAIEGLALAAEGKGDQQTALTHYQALEALGATGFEGPALYQQARLQKALGKLEEAKASLKKASEKLPPQEPGEMIPSYERQRVIALAEDIDPELAAELTKPPPITAERLEELKAQMQRAVGQAETASAPKPPPVVATTLPTAEPGAEDPEQVGSAVPAVPSVPNPAIPTP